ncbi:MAG: holo-ACP synthase [Alphaproteobacteria bacterium]
MILGVGTDIVDARRIGKSIDQFADRFTDRIFTTAERTAAAASNQPKAYLAKRFAAKEAVYKALSGAGVSGLGWQQAETLSLPNGAPVMSLTGQCKTALEALTPDGYKAQISISLSDEPPYALAFVIINAVPLKLDS